MFSFATTFNTFKNNLSAAFATALSDIDTKCHFTINNGKCHLFYGYHKPGLNDRIQEALDTMEWGDVQVSDTFDLDLDWNILDCLEQVFIWIEPTDDSPMTAHIVCNDKQQFEDAMIRAGYEMPSE